MKLKLDEMEELNKLLASKKLDVPDFRRRVSPSGGNFKWLQKNLASRNPLLSSRLIELLEIKIKSQEN